MHVGPELAGLMESTTSSFFFGFMHASFSSAFLLLPKSSPCSSFSPSSSSSWIREDIVTWIQLQEFNISFKGPTESEELDASLPEDSPSELEQSASPFDPACTGRSFYIPCMHASKCELLVGLCQPNGKHPASLGLVAHAVSLAIYEIYKMCTVANTPLKANHQESRPTNSISA